MADGLIVTGNATGDPANPFDLDDTVSHTHLPVLVGSGVTSSNLINYSSAQGLIVGSYFKKQGRWDKEIDPQRIQMFMEVASDLKGQSK